MAKSMCCRFSNKIISSNRSVSIQSRSSNIKLYCKNFIQRQKNILASVPNLSIAYKNQGELVDKDFNDSNIANNDAEGAALKEDLTTCRQRIIRLTDIKTQERLQVLLEKATIAMEKIENTKKRKAEELASGIEPKRRKPYKPRTKKTRKAKLTYF